MKIARPTAEPRPRRRAPAAAPPAWAGRPAPALAKLPLVLIGLLGACLLLPRVHEQAAMRWAFGGTAGALLVWQLALWAFARRRALVVEVVPPVRQHYIQACVQLCLYAYWGWFWVERLPTGDVRPIYAQAPLIAAQVCYLYAFDALWAWSRGRAWRLASGPLPIVLSTNLFIWFRDDWFVWQFVMLTVGLLGKEFVKWHKEGRRTHVFNPSGFGLAVAASVLIATGNVDLTRAKDLATTIEEPALVFLFLFGLGLVVQWFFAVTLMTFAAAVTMVVINFAYTQATGVYLFASTNLPAAAFLGLMLLMTDPSTSPRSNLGRALFGVGYGTGYVVVFQALGAIGAPELFAKLFPVPILNVTVQWLDRLARAGATGRLEAKWQTALRPVAMNRVHIGLWAATFFVLWGSGHIGHLQRDLPHPGDSIPFWRQALADGKPEAARKLAMVAASQALRPDAAVRAAALNELGVLTIDSTVVEAGARTELKSAANWWAQAMAAGSLEACENLVLLDLFHGARTSDREPALAFQRLRAAEANGARGRACFLVGAGFEAAGNAAVALQLYRRCGADPFAQKGVARLALARPQLRVPLEGVAEQLEAAATAGDGEAAWYLAHLFTTGRGVPRDAERARALRRRAIELGFAPAVASRDAAELPPFQPPRFVDQVPPPWSTAYPRDTR